MTPDTKVALERSRMTVEINYLTAVGQSLLLESINANVKEESDRLYKEAMDKLSEANFIHEVFVARFPNSLNIVAQRVL